MDAYVTKPLSPANLFGTIEQLTAVSAIGAPA